MASRGYLPETDAGLSRWSANFLARVLEDPQAVGLTPELSAAYQATHQHFAACLLASNPDVRSKVTTQAKRAATLALKTQARLLVSLVRGTAGVSDAQKARVGITIPRRGSAIAVPTFAPIVAVKGVDGYEVTIWLRGPSADRRGRPDGVGGAVIVSHVGEQPPRDPDDWHSEGATGRTTHTIRFERGVVPFAKVWIAAAWMNPRKQRGPFSTPVETNLGTWLVQATPGLRAAA